MVLKRDHRYHSREQQRDVMLLEPTFRRKVLAIVADCHAHGIHVSIEETYRSQARQFELYGEHVTQLAHVGVHGFGLAADLVPVHPHTGQLTWDWPQAFALIQKLAHVHGVISGSDWGHPERRHSFVDAPHLQRVSVADQGRLFSGVWYPAEAYTPGD